ncbi:hypothetical protein HERIO_1557 [Hepatospora eriocheir]|uniref:Uncharacterized protein n=1 Tax=Hepatospora eriocheir TaxID=1081669 RepID=A0A1X0Q9S7_9MICR|nr:hypothetical protein HERIO_1557 [Hepatospora eriocheir]
MLLTVFFYLNEILSDNIQIYTNEFDKLIVNNTIIESNNCINYNSIKISFKGYTLYSLIEKELMVYELIDETVYFSERPISDVDIVYEMKYYGLTLHYWSFVFFIMLCSSVTLCCGEKLIEILSNFI